VSVGLHDQGKKGEGQGGCHGRGELHVREKGKGDLLISKRGSFLGKGERFLARGALPTRRASFLTKEGKDLHQKPKREVFP